MSASKRIESYAEFVQSELRLEARDARFAEHTVAHGVGLSAHQCVTEAWPTLHVDDVSAIPFLQDIVGVEFYQLRARIRAGDGDIYAATCAPVEGYDRYNAETLGLGRPEFLYAPTVATPSEVAKACSEGVALQRIVERTSAAGGLTIHPYMGSECVWKLAELVAEVSGQTVQVVAPPPSVTGFANHKGHVLRAARALLDDGILGGKPCVDGEEACDVTSLADSLMRLAKHYPRVALKLTRCASAMGNILIDAASFVAMDPAHRLSYLTRELDAKEWVVGDEVLAMAWEDASSSPSTQLWIPDPREGKPTVEGVYEQLLVGQEQVFLGAIPSGLGIQMDARLIEASRRLGTLFQRLGYRGRCSFDFIIASGDAKLVECNGRWGGTSTPMHLVERLRGRDRGAYRARDVVSESLQGVTFEELVDRLGSSLYDASTGQGQFVLYNVGCLERHGKLDVIALGATEAESESLLEDAFPQVAGFG